MFKLTVLSVAALGLAAAITTAAAQPTVSEVTVRARPRPNVEVRTKVVNYRDLNTKSPEGVETLLGRIRQAAEVVCTPEPNSKNLPEVRDYERCKAEAIHGAVAQAKSPALSALYGRVG